MSHYRVSVLVKVFPKKLKILVGSKKYVLCTVRDGSKNPHWESTTVFCTGNDAQSYFMCLSFPDSKRAGSLDVRSEVITHPSPCSS